ncbi:hypothetical protein BJY00DRAFT_318671 [Aspergillus carlsbadensis]|nr:hypothetical protein BJY00DRAFT_318671 [Aspergillus carlsbadensis]
MSSAPLPLHARKQNPRNIQTTLNYWPKPLSGNITIDFRKPGAEERFNELESLEEEHAVTIHDIRDLREHEQPTLEKNGFQYIHDPVPGYDKGENWSERRIARLFLLRTEELVAGLYPAATRVLLYTHRIRSQISGPNSPAHIVHSDFTPAGAMQHLRSLLSQDELTHLTQRNTRILALNIWRPLRTVRKDPLALCDWSSIQPNKDIIPNRFVFSDGWLEVAKVMHRERHRWWYCSKQLVDEVVVFKQFDSAAGTTDKGESEEEEERENKERGTSGCIVVHSAFVDPEYVDEEPRKSLEIGAFVFLPG